jgi:hypothetical protein
MIAGAGSLVSHERNLTPASSPDQRRFRRFGVKLPCRVKPRVSHQNVGQPVLEVETLDVSRGGLFFTSSTGLTIGTALDFVLDIPAHVTTRPTMIRCRGIITRVCPLDGGRIGVGATIDHYRIFPITKTAQW